MWIRNVLFRSIKARREREVFYSGTRLVTLTTQMPQDKSNRDKIRAAAKKMVEDKKALIAYSNGEISKEELRERGVRLAMPL